MNKEAINLEEDIAARSGDIDVVWIYDYSWPIWRGGPMFCCDQVGMGYIRNPLVRYAAVFGDTTLQPAGYVDQLADEGRGFASLAEAEKESA